jgi:sugar phosphate permease
MMQALMFVITFMNYAVLHASRSVWSAASKDFTKIYPDAIDKDKIAYMNTCFLFSYGVGGFFSG